MCAYLCYDRWLISQFESSLRYLFWPSLINYLMPLYVPKLLCVWLCLCAYACVSVALSVFGVLCFALSLFIDPRVGDKYEQMDLIIEPFFKIEN